jgi:hypothetical protein
MTVYLTNRVMMGDYVTIIVSYSTTAAGTSLSWMRKE